jgi:hypothetical protein
LLCGGAAAAMIFRYWGDAHASVQQFAPLVNEAAGGIADTDLVAAIRARHWNATRVDGSRDAIRAELEAGRPPMLLIEDRPRRYHFVVAVGIDDREVRLHDPTWGPARPIAFDALQAAWAPTGFWMLRVTPTSDAPRARASAAPANEEPSSAASAFEAPSPAPPGTGAAAPAPTAPRSACDERLDTALDAIASSGGLDRAANLLAPLIDECPESPGPARELAGVRFAQRRWREAGALAETALDRDPADRYAADVLGSSRFMLNDFTGALHAWNRIGRPILDSVHITGLTRTRYSLLAEALALPPESLLTADAFRLARRRLESMPDLSSTRIALRPEDDRFAVVDVAVVERAALPRNVIQWTAAGVQAALEREVAANVPGRTGQGDTWSASWGWWEHRPRVSVGFDAPLASSPRGVWHLGLAWEAQAYGPEAASLREERLGGEIGLSSWLTPNVRATLGGGLDAWTRADGDTNRTVRIAVTLEQRLIDDHVSIQINGARWAGFGAAPGFSVASVDASARTRRDPAALVLIAHAGANTASSHAPLGLWSGAGEGRSRAPLLRAHALLRGGRVDGPVFGRQLLHATMEAQHWLARPTLVRIGGAAFVDAARATDRPGFASGRAAQADAGIGLRVRVPGRSGVLHVDYARGLRDGERAWVVGWQNE